MKIATEICIEHLYVSAAHNFFGHHGRAAGTNPAIECAEIQYVAERGIVGDRFFNGKPNHAGQITFFAMEVFSELCRDLNIYDKLPSVFRRNVITSGMDLNEFDW
jgi:MOSC domain-containing protein YiiM